MVEKKENPVEVAIEPEVSVEEPKAKKKVKKTVVKFRIGDIGQEVKALQKELGLPETGIYDVATDKAAR